MHWHGWLRPAWLGALFACTGTTPEAPSDALETPQTEQPSSDVPSTGASPDADGDASADADADADAAQHPSCDGVCEAIADSSVVPTLRRACSAGAAATAQNPKSLTRLQFRPKLL